MKRLSLTLSWFFLVFAAVTSDLEAPKWAVFSFFLYSLPLLTHLTKKPGLRIASTWFGIFLILQTLLSYTVYQKYHHLTPNLHYEIDVQGEGLPGIQGLQTISTDALGFRTTKKIDYHNKANGLRIFALGASTTEQIYLDDRKGWTHTLQEVLSQKLQKNVEVINTGVSGLRMVHIYDNFKKILRFHPDIAVFLVGVNDWNKDILNHFDPTVEKLNRLYAAFGLEYYEVTKWYLRNTLFGLAIQTIPLKGGTVEPVAAHRIEKGEYFTKQNNTLTRKDVRVYSPTDILQEYQAYLLKTAKLCLKEKIQCLFLTQPNAYKKTVDEKTKKYFWMTPPNADYTLDLPSLVQTAEVYNNRLKAIARENSISFCDLDAAVPPSLESFYDEVHFNEFGASLVGKLVSDCLLKMH